MNQYVKIQNFLPQDEFLKVLDYVLHNRFVEISPPWDLISNTFRSMIPMIAKSLKIEVVSIGEVHCWTPGGRRNEAGIIKFVYSLEATGLFYRGDWDKCGQNCLIAYPCVSNAESQEIFNPKMIVEGCLEAFDPESYQPSLLIED